MAKHIHKSELKKGFSLFGNKGACWQDKIHIYKSGTGNLCGTPALSSNWAKILEHDSAGCPECIAAYQAEQK